jgi:uncharacterized protein YndB with AHSA1/START domain
MADSGGLTLQLNRVVAAHRRVVFRACTEPDEVARWWGPHGFTTPHIELDLRVGGRYRFAMQPPEGELFHLSGEFRAIEPPALLEYTFRWEQPDPDDRETVVNLAFQEAGDSTEITLVQSGFATEARRALHDGGWSDSFDRLQDVLSRRRDQE